MGAYTLINTTGGNQSAEIFIVKYDAAGNVLWAISESGTSNDYARAITIDAFGDILVTGYFVSPSITLDTFGLHFQSLSPFREDPEILKTSIL